MKSMGDGNQWSLTPLIFLTAMSYISNDIEFLELTNVVESILNWKEGLNCDEVRYIDRSEFNCKGFISFISKFSELSKDDEFYFYDLSFEQSLLEQYKSNFLQYPIIKFDSTVTDKDYKSELNKEYCIKNYYLPEEKKRSRDAFFIVSITYDYVIFPKSMKWHIYANSNTDFARVNTTIGFPDEPPPHGYIAVCPICKTPCFLHS